MPAAEYIDYTSALPKQKTLVCVTDQKKCDRIITAGKALADITATDLSVVSVSKTNQKQEPESVEYLFSVAKQNNAEMNILFSDDVFKAIVKYIKENKVVNVLTGIPSSGNSIALTLRKKFTHVNFFMVEIDGALKEIKDSDIEKIN